MIKDLKKKLEERSQDYVNNAQLNSLENYLRPIKINDKVYINNFEYNKINKSNLIDDFISFIKTNNNDIFNDENENENEIENEEINISRKSQEEDKKDEDIKVINKEDINNNINNSINEINNNNNSNNEALKNKNKNKNKKNEDNKKKLLKNNCCDCLKSVKKFKDLKFYAIKTKNNEIDVDHLLCEECIKKYKKEFKKIKINDDEDEKDNKNKNNNKNDDNNNNDNINNDNNNNNNNDKNNEKCINCNICKKKHELKEISYNQLFKNGDDCCCIFF